MLTSYRKNSGLKLNVVLFIAELKAKAVSTGLPRSKTSYVYKDGLVYWGYHTQQEKDYDHEVDYNLGPVVLNLSQVWSKSHNSKHSLNKKWISNI